MAKQRRVAQDFVSQNSSKMISFDILFVCVLLKAFFLGTYGGDLSIDIYICSFVFLYLLCEGIAKAFRSSASTAVSYRTNREQYKNAFRFFRRSMLFSFIVGCILTLVFVAFSSKITIAMFHMGPYGRIAFVILACCIPLRFLCEVLLGCFEGVDYLYGEGIARIILIISNVLFSLVFIFLGAKVGMKHSLLLHDENVLSAYAMAGAAFGLFVSMLLQFAWLLTLSRAIKKRYRDHIYDDISRTKETFLEQSFVLLRFAVYPLLKRIIYFGSFFVLMILTLVMGKDSDVIQVLGGFFSSHMIWYVLPITFAMIYGMYFRKNIQNVMKHDDLYHGSTRMLSSLKNFIVFVLPICVIIACSNPMLNGVILQREVTDGVLSGLAFTCFVISIFTGSLLSGMDKQWISMISRVLILVLQSIMASVFLKASMDVKTLLLITFIGYGAVVLVDLVLLLLSNKNKKNIVYHLCLPLIPLAAQFVVAFVLSLLSKVVGDFVSILLIVFVSFLVHSVVLLFVGCIHDSELKELPQKSILTMLGSLLGLYR